MAQWRRDMAPEGQTPAPARPRSALDVSDAEQQQQQSRNDERGGAEDPVAAAFGRAEESRASPVGSDEHREPEQT